MLVVQCLEVWVIGLIDLFLNFNIDSYFGTVFISEPATCVTKKILKV